MLVISGHRASSWMVPDSAEFIHIPSLDSIYSHRAARWGRLPFIREGTGVGLSLRAGLLASCIESFSPDCLICDHLALGQDYELDSIIKSSKIRKRVLLLRGVLGSPGEVAKSVFSTRSMDAIKNLYDRVLIMCDQKVIDVARFYGLTSAIKYKMEYCGYAVEPIEKETIELVRSKRKGTANVPWVVCSAGGGLYGEAFLDAVRGLRTAFPDALIDVVHGPRSRQESSNTLDGLAASEWRERTDLPLMHASCDYLMSTAGYNTLIEGGIGSAQMLVAPVHGSFEQYFHAKRFARHRPLLVVNRLSQLPRELERFASKRTFSDTHADCLDFGGLQRAAERIMEIVDC